MLSKKLKMGSTQPYLRSPLARALYEKLIHDELLRKADKSEWYKVNVEAVAPEISDKFTRCSYDDETDAFIENCYEKSDWFFTQLMHSVFKSILCWFMTSTSVNGLIGRGSMFVVSSNQFLQLLDQNATWRANSLLDLGAGDGEVTKRMAPYFTEVYATEVSGMMQKRLKHHGFSLLGIDEWHDRRRQFDVISCLNLLDRCQYPATLLQQMKAVLRPDTGRLLVAVVIPFRPYVESGAIDNKPSEQFHIIGETFEEQVNCLIQNIFHPAGYSVEKFTRVPYLCEGDLYQSFFWLSDAVFVLKPSS